MRVAVFLDRDGVLNAPIVRDGRPYPPQTVEELTVLPGVTQACARLREAGLMVVIVTNQPDVARGTQTREVVDEINDALRSEVVVDDVRVCWHDDKDACACRKPLPGLLVDAARDLDIDLDASYMVGDRWKDVEAGRAANCHTVYVDRGYGERRPSMPSATVSGLAEAVDWILKRIPEPLAELDRRR